MPHRVFGERSPALQPPLHREWNTSLPSRAFIFAPPVGRGESVFVRGGQWVESLGLANGDLRWQVDVGVDDAQGRGILAGPQGLITVVEGTEVDTLLALDWEDGGELWRIPLEAQLGQSGLAVAGDVLYASCLERTRSGGIPFGNTSAPMRG